MHEIIKLFKLSSFKKFRNKNKFSIFNLTRIMYSSITIVLMIIIEILLYLNTRINFTNIYIFNSTLTSSKFIKLLKYIFIFFKSTISITSTHKFFNSNKRLCVISFTCFSITISNFSSFLSSSDFTKFIFKIIK